MYSIWYNVYVCMFWIGYIIMYRDIHLAGENNSPWATIPGTQQRLVFLVLAVYE